jgi:hypothetical protein
MPQPVNKELYERVKEMASKKFEARTGAYRSMWIVKKYKELGGTYRDDGGSKKLQTWRKEKWIDLNQPKEGGGYEVCGHKNTQNNKYPLCRPSKTINKDTPKKYQDISKSNIRSVNLAKQRIKNKGNVKF